MKSTVETLSPTRVRLAIEVPFAELEPSLRKAYKEIGAQVNVPGFRKGKVPNAIIDQRIGRSVVLDEAKNEMIRLQTELAIREHRVRRLGPAEVEVTDFADGQPLRFTAELDVRPEFALPTIEDIEVTVDAVMVSDAEVDAQVEGLRLRFATLKPVERAAQHGDFVQIDLNATVDGEEVPGGSATNLSHQVGSSQLLPGLDETIDGMAAGESASFTTELVGGDYKDRQADVTVTVRSVRERELPELDDDFAGMASEFDTLDELRGDLAERLGRVKRVEQLYGARDKALEALVAAADIPAPEGVVRDEVQSRREAMDDQLERMGVEMEQYLENEGKTKDQLDAELTSAAAEGVKIQLLLDALADAEKLEVTDDEFGHEVVHRAQRAGMSPQQYYDQLLRTGMAALVFSDVRRNKALGFVMERVTIKDTNGDPVSLDELRRTDPDELAAAQDHAGHDHDHAGHDHDHAGHDHDHAER